MQCSLATFRHVNMNRNCLLGCEICQADVSSPRVARKCREKGPIGAGAAGSYVETIRGTTGQISANRSLESPKASNRTPALSIRDRYRLHIFRFGLSK